MKQLIQSWMGAYQMESDVQVAETFEDLERLVNDGYKIVGNHHSYNRSALHQKCFRLGKEFRFATYSQDGVALVGAAATIKDVMETLAKRGQRLPNHGNNMTQTLVGACKGGTHGFGEASTMQDMVLVEHKVHGIVWAVTIRTFPLTQYEVTNCVCPLSEIGPQSENERAFAVMPYSGVDPICIVADYKELPLSLTSSTDKKLKYNVPASWWRLKLFWRIDALFPSLRRFTQRLLNFGKMQTWTARTDPQDLDAKYHQAPGVSMEDHSLVGFLLWSYKPTHTSHNMALACQPGQTEQVIKFAVEEANRIKKGFLTCFIGVRELKDQSPTPYAMNHRGPANALDFYCLRKDFRCMEKLQFAIQEKFEVVPHRSKSVGLPGS